MKLSRRQLVRYGMIAPFATLHNKFSEVHANDAGRIARVAIYPPIGFARIGNSTESYLLAPEVPGTFPAPAKGYKDPTGCIYPQAVRFRIYAFDNRGRVLGELTANNAQITWKVHVANKKSAWYDFDQAFDIPESADLHSGLRNAQYMGADREKLVIDPGPREISGRNTNSHGTVPEYQFTGGSFCGIPVSLGDLRTDPQGRLVVLGGRGFSSSFPPDQPATTFANNENWHDDISDGPVDASVIINGRKFDAEGAWVVTAPPNYAPGLQGVVTLYDVMYEVGMQLGMTAPSKPSFTRQIWPLLQRSTQYQWVNKGVLMKNGWGSQNYLMRPELLLKLANPSVRFKSLRQSVFEQFRNPNFQSYEPDKLPPVYGDATTLPATSNRQFQAVLESQYQWLGQWASGQFIADLPSNLKLPQWPPKLEQLPLQEQPEALNRASLDNCLGGPFHPGCELTWPVRQPLLYGSPFRIARRKSPEPDFGPVLTQKIALAQNGPLAGSGPGDLSRWMAVPWQTDTSSCLYAYSEPADVYLPTFWPARVPNNVLTHNDFASVMNSQLPMAQRMAAFRRRADWFRMKPKNEKEQMKMVNQFISEWSKIGVVTLRPGPGDEYFPAHFWVEQDAHFEPK